MRIYSNTGWNAEMLSHTPTHTHGAICVMVIGVRRGQLFCSQVRVFTMGSIISKEANLTHTSGTYNLSPRYLCSIARDE